MIKYVLKVMTCPLGVLWGNPATSGEAVPPVISDMNPEAEAPQGKRSWDPRQGGWGQVREARAGQIEPCLPVWRLRMRMMLTPEEGSEGPLFPLGAEASAWLCSGELWFSFSSVLH